MPAVQRAGSAETGERELNENNIIHIINGDIEREDPFMYYTNRDGVDIVFDYQMEKAKCYVKRQRPLYLPPLATAEKAARQQVEVDIDSEF
eukprot:scaffold305467_cov71-Attheya_sp.AAC.1